MKRYMELKNYYRELWWELSSELELNIDRYSIVEKKKKEKEFTNCIDNIIKFIESYPKDEKDRILWRKRGNKYLDEIITTQEIFKLGTINKQMKDNFIKCTKSFIKESKNFDREMTYESIGQAMRNVWIINMLQEAFGSTVAFSKSIFGYSMLYPYTDNYLDSCDISTQEKMDFNERFTKLLNGEKLAKLTNHERQVYKLLQFIEEQYSRDDYQSVYDSLMLIHNGQIMSLSQQDEKSIPYERDILGISIQKGGASVIVDGNLVRGDMNYEEEKFCYGYGFLLQLCDDLQDVKNDKDNNHFTIMSQLASLYKLDTIVTKLINLTIKVVDDANCFSCKDSEELKELIKKNCLFMILFATIDNKKYFSKEYINSIEEYLPFRLGYCTNLKGLLINKFKSIKKEYNGVSLEEIILEFIE